MKIAKIIGSHSHVDYVGRVVDVLDADEPPGAEDYGFAQFVSLPLAEGQDVVGVIYNTELLNPEYGQLGPRLSPPVELSVLSPDILHEQGVLIHLLLLGWREGGRAQQGVPRRVIPVGQDVHGLPDEEVQAFHRDASSERVQLHYYSQVVAHAGAFAVALIEAIIAQLEPGCAPEERQRLCVLKKSLVWQRTLGGARL